MVCDHLSSWCKSKSTQSLWCLNLPYLATHSHTTGHVNVGLTSSFDDLLLPPHLHLPFYDFSPHLSVLTSPHIYCTQKEWGCETWFIPPPLHSFTDSSFVHIAFTDSWAQNNDMDFLLLLYCLVLIHCSIVWFCGFMSLKTDLQIWLLP